MMGTPLTTAFKRCGRAISVLAAFALMGCDGGNWNDPNPSITEADKDKKILYSVFTDPPKHLDPVRTYNLDESEFIDQIYEPPLEYHYLKRPYELQPLTVEKMPEITYTDKAGNKVAQDSKQLAFSIYHFQLKKGIQYQPHPSFAKDAKGEFVYRLENQETYSRYKVLDDFDATGTKELVADDYIYQYKRMADATLQMPIWDIVSQYVVGMKELREQIAEDRKSLSHKNDWLDLRQYKIAGITKIDDYNFTVKLNGKYPQFKYWLAFHFFAPIPVELDRFYHLPGMKDKSIVLDYHPVGTGPYMMTVHKPNHEIILERNPNYHEDFYPSEGEPEDEEKGLLVDVGKQLPLIDKVIFRLEKEGIPAWTKFLQGYYDRSGIGADSFDQAVSVDVEGISLSDNMKEKGISLAVSTEPATYYLGFNMLDDVIGGSSEKTRKLRQAIAIAFDEQEQISIFRNGRGEIAMSPLPPGVFGYVGGKEGINPYVFDWLDGKAQRKSIEEAKRLLAEAGYKDGIDTETGKPLVLNLDTTGGGGAATARFNWLKKQFKKLDIELNIRATDYNRFQDKMETGKAQIFFWGWFADYPDPENFLFLLYGPNGRVGSGGSGVNSSNFDHPEFNKLFNKMKSMEDSPERMAIIRDMISIYHRELPWASGFHPQAYVLGNAWMKNYKRHGISRGTLKFQNLDPELREQKRKEWNKPVLWPLALVLLIFIGLIVPGYRAYKRRLGEVIEP